MNDALRTSAVDDLDLLHQRQPEALRDPALDLALDRQRVHRLADVLRGRDLDHPHEPELGVDVDDRAVGGERERHVRVALAAARRAADGRAVVVLAGRLDRPSPIVAAAARSSSSRTARHAACTAPPVMYVWRDAEDEPAEPTCVSAGSTSTFSTPSSVRAICPCTVTRPWPTSAAAVWTSTSGSPPAEREPHARGRVVVEALGEADVLEADGVADAAPHALAAGDVGDPAGHAAAVARAAAGRARDSSSSATGAGQSIGAPVGIDVPVVHRVAQPQLDRVHLQRGGELVHLRLVREAGLHGAEPAHRAARRVVGVDDVGVDPRVRHLVRARARTRRRSSTPRSSEDA